MQRKLNFAARPALTAILLPSVIVETGHILIVMLVLDEEQLTLMAKITRKRGWATIGT